MKKKIACFAIIACFSLVSLSALNVSAEAKLLGTDSSGNEIYGGVYDELVGFDEYGKPIIVDKRPVGILVIPEDAPAVDILPVEDGIDIVYGDIDFNETVDIVDLLKLSQNLLGDIEFTDSQKIAADVNADEKIDIIDLVVLKQYIIGEQIQLGKK